MLFDYFRLAYQGASNRKLRSWLTMIGIFIGIAAVIALISLSQGLKIAISEQFAQLGSDKLIVQSAESGFGPPGTGVTNAITKDDKTVIEKVNGVDIAVGRLIRSVKMKFHDEISYDYVVTIPDDNAGIDLAVEANNYKIVQGRLLKKSDKYKIMVGGDFADDKYDLPVELRDKLIIEDKEFKVIGILKKSGNPQQDQSVVIPEAALRELLDIQEDYDIIPVKILEGENINVVEERIKKELRKYRDVEEGKEDFSVETPGDILGTLNNILLIVQGVLIGIAAISLLVGGIGIMNTMYTAVTERTKEIGIMKATGAKNKQILLLFLIESGFLGFFGGLIGVILGMSISFLVEYAAFQALGSSLIQSDFDPVLIISTLLFAFIVGALSGLTPARQAANMKPVDALRK
jgi:putative ABC transport system permease protein